MRTSEYLEPIINEIFEKLNSHDIILGEQCWMDPKEEPLKYFVQNMDRKMFVVQRVFEREGIEKGKVTLDDSVIDLIGYALLFTWRLRNKGE
jgi:hypothetical protein